MVSRLAKAFQDYTVNVVIQKFGAKIFTDGLQHSMRLPYQDFEDQRSGETLSILTKVRADTEKFIGYVTNVLFGIIVSVVFVSIYATRLHWSIVPIYLGGAILIGAVTNLLSKKIKVIQKAIVGETTALAGTIRENLSFVFPNATDSEMIVALEKASCHSILSKAQQGLDSIIGEGGLKLSGGEKQRLSIARALLRHPHLLIFDEATSSLDSITEEEITRTIHAISEEREQITVMIAHRLSTIMHANRIYVLEKGQIVETGTHEALLAEKGLYYAMWRQQIGERKVTR